MEIHHYKRIPHYFLMIDHGVPLSGSIVVMNMRTTGCSSTSGLCVVYLLE